MPGRLVVLLGAGASYDCADEIGADLTPGYQPPLVYDLFARRPTFDVILNKYPGARARADEIRTAVIKRGTGLEDLLRRMAVSSSLSLRRTIWEVPLYLQELLGEISLNWVRAGSTKFETLIATIMESSFNEILILTVNYDRFVEQAVSSLMQKTFTTLSDYIWSCDGKEWALVKLHGSVDWGRRLRPSQKANTWEQIIPRLNELSLDADIRLIGGYKDHLRFRDQEFFYPALSLPVTGKTEFVCSADHLKFGELFVLEATHLLVIGFSGLDNHVLETFIQKMPAVSALRVVCGNGDMSAQTWHRLMGVNPTESLVIQ